MISFEKARSKIVDELNNWSDYSGDALEIFENCTIETKICWVFFYGDKNIELAGNAPIIIDKEYGNLYITGTGEDIKYYLKEFKRLYKKFKNKPEEIRKQMPI